MLSNKMLNFKNTALLATTVFGALCLMLFFLPAMVFWLFQVDGTASAEFMLRRTSLLFLGLSIISFLSRNAHASEMRNALCLGISISMSALALLGLSELAIGNAGMGIILAVIIELYLAVNFFSLSRTSV